MGATADRHTDMRDGSEWFRCVYGKSRVWSADQCPNKAKHDPDADGNPTKCGIHCHAGTVARKARVKAKNAEKDAANEAEASRRRTAYLLQRELESIVREIAAGHNDPAELCRDWVARKDSQ